MELPSRGACFACGSDSFKRLYRLPTSSLMSCRRCRAEWLEGVVESDQAYSYEGLDELNKQYLEGRGRRFASYMHHVLPGGRGALLDVGCGTGEFLLAVARSGWSPTGVELTEEAAAVARECCEFEIACGDICDEDLFPAGAFDVVTLWGVLEHVPDPVALLTASRRLLHPGGMLLIETPNPQGLFRQLSMLLLRITGGRVQRPLRETLGAGHLVWFAPLAMRAVAGRLGMDVVDLRGSRNSTRILLARWGKMPLPQRLAFQCATAVVNYVARPLGRANQLTAALRVPPPSPPERP